MPLRSPLGFKQAIDYTDSIGTAARQHRLFLLVPLGLGLGLGLGQCGLPCKAVAPVGVIIKAMHHLASKSESERERGGERGGISSRLPYMV